MRDQPVERLHRKLGQIEHLVRHLGEHLDRELEYRLPLHAHEGVALYLARAHLTRHP